MRIILVAQFDKVKETRVRYECGWIKLWDEIAQEYIVVKCLPKSHLYKMIEERIPVILSIQPYYKHYRWFDENNKAHQVWYNARKPSFERTRQEKIEHPEFFI